MRYYRTALRVKEEWKVSACTPTIVSGLLLYREIPLKHVQWALGHMDLCSERCLRGDMNLETIRISDVVEARGENELTLRKGEEGQYLGHK